MSRIEMKLLVLTHPTLIMFAKLYGILYNCKHRYTGKEGSKYRSRILKDMNGGPKISIQIGYFVHKKPTTGGGLKT